jgi:hypothetical protein
MVHGSTQEKEKIMPTSRTIKKHITVDKVNFTLEIYPVREGKYFLQIIKQPYMHLVTKIN